MPRTTLQLEDDVLKAAKAHAARHRLTLSQAVSELVRQAAERPLLAEDRSGFRVVRLSPQSPRVTAALVDRLREDLKTVLPDLSAAALAGSRRSLKSRIISRVLDEAVPL